MPTDPLETASEAPARVSCVLDDDLTAYWQERRPDWIFVDWSEAGAHCWRCGMANALQRCHLVPKSRGGKDEPANLIRLCWTCHLEQPNCTTPETTWLWLRATRYCGMMRFHERWMREYELIFGEPPCSRSAEPEALNAATLAAMENAVTHWGQPGPNPATVAAAVRDAGG